jgi:hypothetical protein
MGISIFIKKYILHHLIGLRASKKKTLVTKNLRSCGFCDQSDHTQP